MQQKKKKQKRKRRAYTAADLAEMWDRWKRGESSKTIARFGCMPVDSGTVARKYSHTRGGGTPCTRTQ